MKPILFNTEMVRAILEGRKTVTRRIIKPVAMGLTYEDESPARNPPYQPGDILYVRETWKQATIDHAGGGYAPQDVFLYKADEPIDTTGMMVEGRWHPSIHMPREAARIFLRVTDVRVERLQDITAQGSLDEGIKLSLHGILDGESTTAPFTHVWDSTIKPADRALYGWAANPWVWVISFERITKEEAQGLL